MYGKEDHRESDKNELKKEIEKHGDECEEHKTQTSDTWQDPVGRQVSPPDEPKHEVSKDVGDDHSDGALAAYYLSIANISKELTETGTFD
ncbi:hypothetical protein L484_001382 [Morus notabilis]|uniref:Uncharacterized protein n=1 Tax=Morus notabilis TaxID=981085 RepID=W9QTW8_9ROSA|nr:hypothetical protein L484_001382 [Morus notabilis]